MPSPRMAAVATCLLVSGIAGLPPTGSAQKTVPVTNDAGMTEPRALVLPPKDRALQAALRQVLEEPRYRSLVARKQLSVALVDVSSPDRMRYAAVDDDRMRYAASLPKIAIMLTVFDQVEKGKVEYTPQLRAKMERMIRRSSNREATELIELVGFEAIAATLQDPHYELYSKSRNGGLWVGKDYGGMLGRWRRDPLHGVSHGATARQVARFFVMLQRGELVSPRASAEMKSILSHPEIKHKFVLGLSERPRSRIFRKSGTWKEWHCDAALVERDGKIYVAVALLESKKARGVLANLILRLDDIVHQSGGAMATTTGGGPSRIAEDSK